MENSGSPSKFILRRRFLHNGSPTEEFLKIKIYGRFRRLLYIILYRCTPPKASRSRCTCIIPTILCGPKKIKISIPFRQRNCGFYYFEHSTDYLYIRSQNSANKRTSALQTRNEIKTNIKLSNLFKIATSSHASPSPMCHCLIEWATFPM